jgi:hypothetical protein
MIKRCRSTALTLLLSIGALLCLGEVSTANQISSALPSTNERPVKASETNNNAPSISPANPKTDKIESAVETELKILKEKNLLIADFQNSLISIVIWSLSAVVSVVILLVGASLFTNFKLHEKDVQRIQADYDAKIKIFRSEMDTSLTKAGQEMANVQEARSQQDLNRMLNQAAEVRSQFETVRLSLEGKFDQLLSGTTKLETKVDNLEKIQSGLKAELRKAETLIWDIRKVPANVLISALQGLDAALLSGVEWHIEDFIMELKRVIKTDFIELKNSLDEELQGFIEKRLVKLEIDYPEDAKEIRQLIAEYGYLNTAAG